MTDGRTGRVDSDDEVRRGIRNGVPVGKPYVYRGKGYDTLTWGLRPSTIRKQIAAAEGDGYQRPMTYSDVIGSRLADAKPCGTRTAYKRHVRRGETPCRACTDANAAYQREYAQRRAAQ